MLTKAWIAILLGLLLGSLFLSSGCGWCGRGYSSSPYYGAPCNCGVPHTTGAPAGGVPAAGSTPGWHSVPAASGAGAPVGGAENGSATTP